jgi:hypothetical protein
MDGRPGVMLRLSHDRVLPLYGSQSVRHLG